MSRSDFYGSRLFVCAVLGSLVSFANAFAESVAELAPPVSSAQVSQLQQVEDARNRSRRASSDARSAGRNSIGRGNRHMSHGKHHHHPSEVHTGAFEVAQGILGLLASAAADGMSKIDDNNGSNLSDISASQADAATTAAAASVSGSSSVNTSGGDLSLQSSGETVGMSKLPPGEQANPEFKDAMAAIKEEFGISQQQMVDELAKGKDGKDLFTNAPRNALTRGEADAAYTASRGAMGDLNIPSPKVEMAAAPAVDPKAGEGSGVAGNNSLRDALARRLASGGDGEDSALPDVSSDIQAALAAQQAEQAKREQRAHQGELDIFEAVHQKYRERENHLRWGEPLKVGMGTN